MRLPLSLFFGAFLLLMGCAASDNSNTNDDVEASGEQTMTRGTVRYVDLEGGFYGIEGEDGAKYNPMNLAEEYREDGLAVRFRYRKRDDVMTTQMWGQNVEILEIERR